MSRFTLILLLLLCEIFNKCIETVAANGNTVIKNGPFLQLEKFSTTRLIISRPLLPHHLSCVATIEERFYYQNETNYYYTWFRNDYELDNLWGRRVGFTIHRNGTLRLPTNEKASGVYRCKINANETAVLSESITVVYPVLKRLQVSSFMKSKSNSSLTLNCPVLSVPPANVSWYINDQIISEVRKHNSYVVLTNGSLVLRKVLLNDTGKYKCLAENQFALKTSRQFTLTIKIEDTNNEQDFKNSNRQSSQLIPNLQNLVQYIPKGANFTLMCFSLNEYANVDWWFRRSKSDNLIKISNHSTEFYNIYNATTEHDQGYYTCKTLSDYQSFHVIVMVPPRIIHPLPSYETLISASLAFSCNSIGNPPPEISWYHNGIHLNSSYSRYISGNELILHSFDPSEDGIYQCFAHNIAGEVYSAAEVRFRHKGNGIPKKNPLKNIRCFPHSFNTINITFESDITESLFIVHIVQENPHRWTSPFAPMKLNQTSHVVISSQLPIYRPFVLITRVLFPTSEIEKNKPQQQTILSSLRSAPVTCCTQGLLLHLVQLGINSTFLTWSQPDLNGKKYFILQFSTNYTHPHPKKLVENELFGTTKHVDLNSRDISAKLEKIVPLSQENTLEILSRVEGKNSTSENSRKLDGDDEIFSFIVSANVSGVVLQNFKRIKVRVLIITTDNENLGQDFQYVQWKTIHNGTTELVNTHFHLSTIESRMLGVYFQDDFNESCVEICLWKIQFPFFNKDQPKCERKRISDSYVTISGLKPMERYRLNFFSCEFHTLYGQLDVQTLPDPPGTISNQRIIRNSGLKLNWDPPLQPNGKVHHYNILWTLGNKTHEANVPACNPCSYNFPNLSETSKVNVSVRVVGETGVGAPIFIDLRNINHQSLEIERSSAHTVFSGVIIGIVLSILCILCFITFFVLQKCRLKSCQEPSTHLNSQSEINFSNLSNIGLQRNASQRENPLQQEYFELQTLIPKSMKGGQIKSSSVPSKSLWLASNDRNSQQCETQNQQFYDRSENNLKELNWNSENRPELSINYCGMVPAPNELNIVLPPDTIPYAYAAFHKAGENKAIQSIKSGVLNIKAENGNEILSNCSNRNRSNDVICLLTDEELEVKSENISNTPALKTISTNIHSDSEKNDFEEARKQINGHLGATNKHSNNNNNINFLLKSTHNNGSNRNRRKLYNGKNSKKKQISTKESPLFNFLLPGETLTTTETKSLTSI